MSNALLLHLHIKRDIQKNIYLLENKANKSLDMTFPNES